MGARAEAISGGIELIGNRYWWLRLCAILTCFFGIARGPAMPGVSPRRCRKQSCRLFRRIRCDEDFMTDATRWTPRQFETQGMQHWDVRPPSEMTAGRR